MTNETLTQASEEESPNATKPAYTVSEFAALFNRHKSWAYRLIYAGQIHVISDFGLMMVPASEIGKIIGTAHRYTGSR